MRWVRMDANFQCDAHLMTEIDIGLLTLELISIIIHSNV